MPARPEAVTEAFPSAGERIRKLQDEIAVMVDEARGSLRAHLWAAAKMADEAQAFPMPPGEKEEYRQIGEAIVASLERLQALDGRK